jgi:hypothetical protein
MATKKKPAKKKAPPKNKAAKKATRRPRMPKLLDCKPDPNVKHAACELAPRVYMEGTDWPEWLYQEFNKRYSDLHARTVERITKEVEEKHAPAKDVETVVQRLFHQLTGLNAIQALHAVAHFLQLTKSRKEVNLELGAKCVALAKDAEQSAFEQHELLTRILAGNFAIIKPLTFPQGGPDINTKKAVATDGEAVVSKRPTD